MNRNICQIIDDYRKIEFDNRKKILLILVANVDGKTDSYNNVCVSFLISKDNMTRMPYYP